MEIKLETGAFVPYRSHEDDAGYDLFAPYDLTLKWLRPTTVMTGVHIALPPKTAGIIKNRSSRLKHGCITDGTIDAGYTGSVGVTLINLVPWRRGIKRGERIAQLVIVPVLTPDLEIVDELDETARGDAGFGSTGNRAGVVRQWQYIE